ncbi:MAG: translation initiation factor IF-2 N-terminal domain-containing protein, partial [Bdellovibrionota bacterium]
METEMLKVYELAKELGIDSISLLDKLKGLNINVKNHMSELKPEEAQAARSALLKPAGGEKAAKKSTAARVRKKTATT